MSVSAPSNDSALARPTPRGRRFAGLALAHVLALWPAGLWYVRRMTTGSGEAWGTIAVAAAVALAVVASEYSAPEHSAPERSAPRPALATLFLLVFGALWWVAPPLIASAFGILSLAALVSDWRYGVRLQPALAGLLLLGLPDISTLQFFVGWPFRVAVGSVVAPTLAALGLEVSRQGTALVVGGVALEIDAPCSGVWMGWGALVLWFVLALARRLDWGPLVRGTLVLLPIVFLANVFRTLALVFVETPSRLTSSAPTWAHEAVGALVFALAAAAVVALSERRPACAPSPSI